MADTRTQKDTPASTARPRPSQAEGERETYDQTSRKPSSSAQKGKDPEPHEKPSQAEGERDRA